MATKRKPRDVLFELAVASSKLTFECLQLLRLKTAPHTSITWADVDAVLAGYKDLWARFEAVRRRKT